MAQLAEKIEPLFIRLDQAAGGWPGLLRQVYTRFLEMRGTEAAASLAYYGLFSIFPLTLLLAALTGLFFSNDMAYWQALALIRELFPFSGDLIDQTLHEIVQQRGAVSLFSVLWLLWAASGFFTVLAGSINMAWPKVKLRSVIHNRLVALVMVAVLFVLLLLSLISSTLVSLLPFLTQGLILNGTFTKTREWITLLRFVPTVFTFLLFVALYRWVPNKSVSWRPVIKGALAASLVWELAKWIFSIYLGSGSARYQSIYGPLAAIIALMFWTFMSNLITLLGAYLVAALDMRAEQQVTEAQQAEARRQAEDRRPNERDKRVRVYETHNPLPQAAKMEPQVNLAEPEPVKTESKPNKGVRG